MNKMVWNTSNGEGDVYLGSMDLKGCESEMFEWN